MHQQASHTKQPLNRFLGIAKRRCCGSERIRNAQRLWDWADHQGEPEPFWALLDVAMEGVVSAHREKLFRVQFEGCDPEEYDLWSIVEPNREGAPELCEWAERAAVGESYITGGGAAHSVTTTRVA